MEFALSIYDTCAACKRIRGDVSGGFHWEKEREREREREREEKREEKKKKHDETRRR